MTHVEHTPIHSRAEEENGDQAETLHRLCPTYASDINSPLRHVRTRIYFTSESHIHSLVNVLRWEGRGGGEVLVLHIWACSASPCSSISIRMFWVQADLDHL